MASQIEYLIPILLVAGGGLVGIVVWLGYWAYVTRARASRLARELEEMRLSHSSSGQHQEAASGPHGLQAADAASGNGDDAAPGPDLVHDRLPELPASLSAALDSGRTVLYVGAEIGETEGAPALAEVLRRLLNRMSSPPTPEELRSLDGAINSGKLDYVAEFIRRRTTDEELRAALQRVYGHPDDPDLPPSLISGTEGTRYRSLAELNMCAVLSGTLDPELAAAFSARSPIQLVPGSRELEQVIRNDPFFLLHLWGTAYPDSPLLFTDEERKRALRNNQVYTRFLSSMVGSKPILFVGATLEEIDNFLGPIDTPSRPQRFAIVARPPGRSDWDLLADHVRTKLNIELVVYQPTPGHSQFHELLATLVNRAPTSRGSTRSAREVRQLTAVRLENIGAFRSLQLNVSEGWNVILGNNACGKSTILKAVALGLCGDDSAAQAFASRLLRVGADEGRVELDVGSETYSTRLVRELDQVRVESRVLTALQRGRWVVLGFPPLRGLSLRDPNGPSSPAEPQPQVSDLLPLLAGGADSRLDSLKQWIVNAYVGAFGSLKNSDDSSSAPLLDSFFDILRDLTPTEEISLSTVETGTWRVLVETADGAIPIEQVSQGMSSMIGWVGTLLQRMYEIYPDSENPQKEAALVLVDEIDAHLHPAWQRALVGLVNKHFSNVQIIATTHSPLVIVGLEPSSVLVARRAPGESEIEIARASDEIDFEGMRADQLLTSPLFGLTTTRGEREQQQIQRYSELLGLKRSDKEQRELEVLRGKMSDWMLDGETEIERAVTRMVLNMDENDLIPDPKVEATLSPEARARVEDGIARLMGEEDGQA